MCTVIDHRRHSVDKRVRHETKSSGVTVLYTLWRLLWSITVHAHTEKYSLFVLYNKNSSGLLKDFGEHEKRKTSLLTWIWRHLCVCPLIYHGQQPIKMHTEVPLLYKVSYHSCQLLFFFMIWLLELSQVHGVAKICSEATGCRRKTKGKIYLFIKMYIYQT